MNIDHDCKNGTTRISVNEDRIDIENADQFREYLLDKIYHGKNQILVDLQKVTFIDSSGLGALVYSLREARKANGTITLSGLSEHVASMFSITRLNKIFKII